MSPSKDSPHVSKLRPQKATTSPSPPSSSTSAPPPTHNTTHNTTHYIYTTYHRALEIIAYLRANPGLPLPFIYATIGLAAELEQPGFLPRPSEVGCALIAAVCVAGVVVGVCALERGGEGDGEGIWGDVWRLWTVGKEEEEEGQVLEAVDTATESSFNAPSLLHRAYQPLHQQLLTRADTSSSSYDTHASGLLGPSPVPPRRTAAPELKHFTGQGFWKHQQKLKAAEKWSSTGRGGRSFEEVLTDVVEREQEQIRGGIAAWLDGSREE
ncbi:hypothetical protein EKO04_001117 [Ascochyta lentis]|uniref:Uncharacterized protein n=1 Tax=Ascochyta lentis TaxID=205686 RepID=A0A8H7JDB4_9PLEO|nr:hypothetical protein EKO04_001117 [Ascochyta lentis]